MIVTCERCATQFQLDDSRVPKEGVRVRCSRCKHAFEVYLPGTRPAESAPEEEESDWQFNQDPPAANPDFAFGGDGAPHTPEPAAERNDTGPAPDESADEPSGGPSGLDLAGGQMGGEHGWEAQAAALDEAEPDSLFEKPSPASLDAAPDASPDAAPEPLARSLFEAPPEEPVEAAEEPTSELDAMVRESPEFGSGLDLDGPARAAEADELASSEPLYADAPGPATSDLGAPAVSRRFDIDPDELIDERPRWQGWLVHAGGAAGWCLVLALFGLGLQGGLRPPVAPAPAALAVADGLEVENLSGRWIEHVEAGPIYVVRGRLVNTRGNSVAAPPLAVELLDPAGDAVASPVPLTLPNRPEDLREVPLDALTGSGLPDRPLGLRAGEQRDVQAVIGPLPALARRIRVVAADPPPAAASASVPVPPAPADPEPAAAVAGEAAAGEPAPALETPPAALAP